MRNSKVSKTVPNELKSAHSPAVQRKDIPANFSETNPAEFHAIRRRQILEKYPEVINLYGNDVRSAYFCFATIVIQLGMAYYVRDMSSVPLLLVLAYVVSGTLNHSLLLAMHEVTHDLFFKQRWLNQVVAVIANLPMGVPAAASFKMYHAEHHSGMGHDKLDTDIPTAWEAQFFTGIVGRAVWIMLQPFFYGIRPFVLQPREMAWSTKLVAIMQISFDLGVLYVLGWKSFFYLLGGTLFGTGLHPMSGHFVAEHFEFVTGQETYSYYGPLNWLTYNVGYHNEHHDFPRIPGSRLPMLKKIAPEFYTMPSYDSWTRVIFDFIVGRNMNLFGRVKRV